MAGPRGGELLKRSLTISLALLAASGYLALASRTEPIPVRQPLSGFPDQVADWVMQQSAPIDQEVVSVLGVDDYLNRVYARPNPVSIVGLYIGYYQSQRQGDTIHSPLNCLPGAGWRPTGQRRIEVTVTDTSRPERFDAAVNRRPIVINLITVQKGSDRQAVAYWYQSRGRVMASEYWGKIYMVIDALRKNRTDGALVRVVAPVNGPGPEAQEAAEQNAIEFVKAIFPLLASYLPG